jgi:hypothetical protein
MRGVYIQRFGRAVSHHPNLNLENLTHHKNGRPLPRRPHQRHARAQNQPQHPSTSTLLLSSPSHLINSLLLLNLTPPPSSFISNLHDLSPTETSEESKQHSREMMEQLDGPEAHYAQNTNVGGERNNIAGGYKATLKNANTGEEAKERARMKLKEMGEEVPDM